VGPGPLFAVAILNLSSKKNLVGNYSVEFDKAEEEEVERRKVKPHQEMKWDIGY
jgi:hypothetical protein